MAKAVALVRSFPFAPAEMARAIIVAGCALALIGAERAFPF